MDRRPNALTLAGTTFSRADVLARKVKGILFRHNLDAKLTEEEQALVVELLKQGHPRAAEKIGSGVKRVKVGIHPQHDTSRCFHVVRTDDTTADFSYRKCIEALFDVQKGKKKKDYAADYESGLLLKIDVEDTRDEASKKRKREDTETVKREEEEEEEDIVEEIDADGQGAAKRQKTLSPIMKVKEYLREFGDVGYVEFNDENPAAGVTVRFTDAAAVPKVQEALKTSKVEIPNLPGIKLVSSTLITGEEEKAYYQRLALDREKSRQNRLSAHRGRGGRHRGGRREGRRGGDK